MTASSAFTGSVPETYDSHLGPRKFHPYGQDMAGRVRVVEGGRLLEVAAGTGIVTEHLRGALPQSVEIVATDVSDPMLDCARRLRGHLPGVTFQPADATALPFPDGSFDAVVCQFGVMFFADRIQGLREMLRVLRPGGTLHYSTWGGHPVNESAAIAYHSIAEAFPSDPPGFLATPFAYHDHDLIREEAVAAGIGDLHLDVVERTVPLPSARTAAVGFVAGTPSIQEITARATTDVETIQATVTRRLALRFGDEPCRIPMSAIFANASV